jgi:hypothetical protein
VASSNSFAPSSTAKKLIPVMLPPGRAKLATTPAETGSSPIAKTIGIVEVTPFAASAETMPPVVAITFAWRAAKSPAKAGSRS